MPNARVTASITALATGAWLLAAPAFAQTTCRLNGQVVPCGNLGKATAWGLGAIALFALIGLALGIFWIMMLVHAATHPIQNRAMWIILMVFTGALGAIIYYFAVKRGSRSDVPSAPASAAAGTASPIAPPVSPQLAEYVRISRQHGTPDDATRKSLIDSGWNAADVDRALRS